jgi:hypothetical protein
MSLFGSFAELASPKCCSISLLTIGNAAPWFGRARRSLDRQQSTKTTLPADVIIRENFRRCDQKKHEVAKYLPRSSHYRK